LSKQDGEHLVVDQAGAAGGQCAHQLGQVPRIELYRVRISVSTAGFVMPGRAIESRIFDGNGNRDAVSQTAKLFLLEVADLLTFVSSLR